MRFAQTVTNALELILPRCCLVCQRPLLHSSICLRCLPMTHLVVVNLDDRPNLPFRSACSVWPYHGVVRNFIMTMKYRPSLTLARLAAEQLADALLEHPQFKCDLVVPVPTSPKNFRKRLFNQSGILAQGIAKKFDLPCDTLALRHLGCAAPQASLAHKARFQNVKRSFESRHNSVAEKSVLLVDDVITTGATVASASLALLKGGASCVNVVALATSDSWTSYLAALQEYSYQRSLN